MTLTTTQYIIGGRYIDRKQWKLSSECFYFTSEIGAKSSAESENGEGISDNWEWGESVEWLSINGQQKCTRITKSLIHLDFVLFKEESRDLTLFFLVSTQLSHIYSLNTFIIFFCYFLSPINSTSTESLPFTKFL